MWTRFKQARTLKFNDFKQELQIILVLFCFALAAGLFQAATPPEFVQTILDQVLELANQVGTDSAMDLFAFILINNLIAVFSVIIGGIVFGVSPMLSAVINGYIIGIVAGDFILSGDGLLLLPGLIPHGVFELPALFLAIALGLKVGRSVFASLQATYHRKGNWRSQLNAVLRSVEPVLYGSLRYAWQVIVPLIVLAALIEATATGSLIDYVANYML